MQTEKDTTQTFDHIPSSAELAQSYTQFEKSDPRSLFYERVLVRPKVPLGWMLLFALLTAGACMLACIGAFALSSSVALAASGCVAVFLLACLLFAKQLLIWSVKTYQALAPAKLRNRCRYEPSCSVYMIMSVEEYGFWRGIRKGIKRWRGCKPPNGGYDLP